MILFITSFIAGVLTILAPCTLPLLPIIIGSSVDGQPGKQNLKKAFVIAISLGTSIVLFTLLLKASTLFINIPLTALSLISGCIILIFGLIALFPSIWEKIPFVKRMNINSNKLMSLGYKKNNSIGDIIIGASLGPVFSTCSPTYFIILATVLPQSLFLGFIYLVAYATGLGLVLIVIAFVGQKLTSRLGGLSDTRGWFKKTLGVLFILVGIAVITGADKKIQKSILESGFFDVTKIEQKLLGLSDKGDVTNTVAPEIVNPSGFINTDSKPITIGEFKNNKVVLLDVWTYSCINCQRTIPYLNAWYAKYKEYGFEIIGLHTPEFAFERLKPNVQEAVDGFEIKYPVVLDNDYATWNAYGNQYWPRKYLINAEGIIVYDHIGEGDYATTEREIQKALMELNRLSGKNQIIPTDLVNLETQIVESSKVKSPEIYFGAGRNVNLANGVSGKTGEQTFTLPESILPNKVYLDGIWKIGVEEAQNKGLARIQFKYNAKTVYMVASSQSVEGVVITIKKDGQFYKNITIKSDSLYTILEDIEYGEHLLEIEIPESELNVFTFTFG